LGWISKKSFNPIGNNISKEIRNVTELRHPNYEFSIQLIAISCGFLEMSDQFDHTTAKGIWNPKPHSDGRIIGFRNTHPNVINDIRSKTSHFNERPFDLVVKTDSHGRNRTTLCMRAISRLQKYQAKGFTIRADPNSNFSTSQLVQLMNDKAEQDELRRQEKIQDLEISGFYTYTCEPQSEHFVLL
jgi:hypothetical protein